VNSGVKHSEKQIIQQTSAPLLLGKGRGELSEKNIETTGGNLKEYIKNTKCYTERDNQQGKKLRAML